MAVLSFGLEALKHFSHSLHGKLSRVVIVIFILSTIALSVWASSPRSDFGTWDATPYLSSEDGFGGSAADEQNHRPAAIPPADIKAEVQTEKVLIQQVTTEPIRVQHTTSATEPPPRPTHSPAVTPSPPPLPAATPVAEEDQQQIQETFEGNSEGRVGNRVKEKPHGKIEEEIGKGIVDGPGEKADVTIGNDIDTPDGAPPPPVLPAVPEKSVRQRRFVVIIPATAPNPDLCKTIVTALALGYPSPIIINWGVDYHDVTGWDGGKNLPKIPGFVDYLDAVMHPEAHPSEKLQEDDLVLMVDAYDIWFQLPAEVLIRRYHKINERANVRLRTEWPGADPMPMRQSIVAASGKNCHPPVSWGSNGHCDILPDSPLRPDLYGPETEKNATKHRDHRPKYINGGLYIGPAGDMRRMFRRAQEKMRKGLGQGIHMASEQGIPGEILGEQEVWRQWRRKNSQLPADDALFLIARDFEYHMGLDYSQELSVQTFWTDTDDGLFDGDFVTLNNQAAIDDHSRALGISPVRLRGIPEDIITAWNPLASIPGAPSWGDMSLYADFFLETVPVILHHNGFKERRESWWHRPWFYKHLRRLVSLRLTQPPSGAPLATAEYGNEIIEYRGPSAEDTDRRPRQMGDSAREPLIKMDFGDTCRYSEEVPASSNLTWWDEVFRDAEGPFNQ